MTKNETDDLAIDDPEHLKRWCAETNRSWLVFRTNDLIDALPWPEGVNVLKGVVSAYRTFRRGIPTAIGTCPNPASAHANPRDPCKLCNNKKKVVLASKDDRLTREERRELRAWLDLLDAEEGHRDAPV